MKNLLLLLALSLFMCSCKSDDDKKQDDENSNTNVYLDINASFNFVPVDENDSNLLQGDNPLTIDDFDIVLYDKKGNPYYFYNPMLGDPKNISIDGEWGGNDWVSVYLSGVESKDSNISITYLRICDKIHTVKGEWEIISEKPDDDNTIGGGLSINVKKIWFDNELVYNADESIELTRLRIEKKSKLPSLSTCPST